MSMGMNMPMDIFYFRMTDGELTERKTVNDANELMSGAQAGHGYIVASIDGLPTETHKVDLTTFRIVPK